MPLETTDITELAEACAAKHPQEILKLAFEVYSPNVALSFSGAEDVALVDMASKVRRRVRVFTLDTGRLHAETHQFLEKVRERYGMPIEVYFPRPEAVEKLVRDMGAFSFLYEGLHVRCYYRRIMK